MMKIDLLWVLIALVVVYYFGRSRALADVVQTQATIHKAMEAATPVVVSGDVNPLVLKQAPPNGAFLPKMNPFLY
jgi:hypothetical protein